MTERTFYVCASCGNVTEKLADSGAPIVCCGEKMAALTPNAGGGGEKHLPVCAKSGVLLNVNIGATDHPMTPEHFIRFIAIVQKANCQTVLLTPDSLPEARFFIGAGSVTVYAYCNVHGLWAAEFKS